MSKPQAGSKFRLSLALPVGAVMKYVSSCDHHDHRKQAWGHLGERVEGLKRQRQGQTGLLAEQWAYEREETLVASHFFRMKSGILLLLVQDLVLFWALRQDGRSRSWVSLALSLRDCGTATPKPKRSPQQRFPRRIPQTSMGNHPIVWVNMMY